jgi:prolipoprotein diacylglyceryl transferase
MYGLLISIGAVLAFLITERAAKKENLNMGLFYQTFNISFIFGLLGARLYHVTDYWNLYSKNPLLILQIWRGGMGIYGAILGGLLGFFLSLKAFAKEKVKLLKWLDVAVLGLPLAQAVGRWGNFFNRELYGIRTNLPWGVKINGELFHPLFLYESILNFILFVILIRLHKRKARDGVLFWIYLIGYGLIRFVLEFIRLRSWTIYGISVAQAISLILIFTGSLGLSLKLKRDRINL